MSTYRSREVLSLHVCDRCRAILIPMYLTRSCIQTKPTPADSEQLTTPCPLIPYRIAHEYVTWPIYSPEKSRSLFSTRLEGGASSPALTAGPANPPGSQAERACGKPKLS